MLPGILARTMKSHSLLSPALLAALLAACGEPPQPVEPSASASHGTVSSGRMPQDEMHAGLGATAVPATPANPHGQAVGEGETYAGVVRLTGERATRRDAYLFLSIVPKGTSMPLCFDRLDLSDESIGTMEGDARVIPFRHESCAKYDGDVELKAQFDLDGYVETKQEGSLVKRFPVEHADQAIDVTLE